MPDHDAPRVQPAASLALDVLAELFTQAFEGYTYAATVTAPLLAQRIRTEQLDLLRSPVLYVGERPAGVALVGLRGAEAWCGGFGIAAAWRGRGLAHVLSAAMIEQARQAEARSFRLEVLTRNAPALHTYLRAGWQIRRDLQVLRWPGGPAHTGAQQPHAGVDQSAIGSRQSAELRHGASFPAATSVAERAPRELLAHFDALHPAPAAWQRDLPVLLVRGGLRGLALLAGEQLSAYALLHAGPAGACQLADFAAADVEPALALLGALQQRYAQITSVNEPAASPLAPAFTAAGFAEIERQHELVLDLA